MAAGLICYLYNFKVLLILMLFVCGIASLSDFLSDISKLIKNQFNGISSRFIYSLVFFILIFSLCFSYLDYQILGYVGILGLLTAVIRIVGKY